jgi:hypothetical protein
MGAIKPMKISRFGCHSSEAPLIPTSSLFTRFRDHDRLPIFKMKTESVSSVQGEWRSPCQSRLTGTRISFEMRELLPNSFRLSFEIGS